MIVIDGRTSDMQVSNFANLEEILVQVMQAEMENRIVTDVFVNDEAFSELYPHQAEDIESSEIQKLEVRSVSVETMAADVTVELHKVINIMESGAKRAATLMRKSDLSEALEVTADLVDVTRHFLGTVSVLRAEFSINRENELAPLADKMSTLLDEMAEMISEEDWFLLADLAEYEFLPACAEWNSVLTNLAQDIAKYKAA